MSARLSDLHRAAFVTGASSGLGRAFAGMLLDEGVRVWGTARESARLDGLSARPGFTPAVLDLADPAGAEAAFQRAAAEAGGAFDLVVNNAGYGVFGPFASVPWPVWEAQISAMLGATARLSFVAWRAMRECNRGTLVNVSSLAVEFPLPLMTGYNVAKAGLSALSESLIFESRGTGVTVIDFRPGDYRTAFNQAMQPASSPTVGQDAARVWRRLEDNLRAAPPPQRAADDLRRALLRGRGGVVRSGGFFQARLAPVLARLAPAPLVRAAAAAYFSAR